MQTLLRFAWKMLEIIGQLSTAQQILAYLAGGGLFALITKLSGLGWGYVWALRVSGFLVVLGLVNAVPIGQAWIRSHIVETRGETKSTISVICGDLVDVYQRFENRNNVHVWYIKVKNDSLSVDAKDVEVKIERMDVIQDLQKPMMRTSHLREVGILCPFENGGYTRTVRPDDAAFVKVASFVRDPRDMWIRLGDVGERDKENKRGLIFNPYIPHRLEMKVRSAPADTIEAHFIIQLLDGELLQMREIKKS
jgi:hypothetical protein